MKTRYIVFQRKKGKKIEFNEVKEIERRRSQIGKEIKEKSQLIFHPNHKKIKKKIVYRKRQRKYNKFKFEIIIKKKKKK